MKFFTIQEAAAELRISVKTLKAHIAAGELRYIDVGRGLKNRRIIIDFADLTAFVESRKRIEPEPFRPTLKVVPIGERYLTFSEIQAQKKQLASEKSRKKSRRKLHNL